MKRWRPPMKFLGGVTFRPNWVFRKTSQAEVIPSQPDPAPPLAVALWCHGREPSDHGNGVDAL
jgi:hypothetical protein